MPARISFYRPTGQSRRSARSAHDHDVFEGLPVRRWHRDWVSVEKPPAVAVAPQLELPLPKDAQLLSNTAQALLAAARAGSATTNNSTPPGSLKKRDAPQAQPLFRAKRWVCYAKGEEPPEPVYLAKVPDMSTKKGDEITGDELGTEIPKRRGPPPPRKKQKRQGRKPGYRKTVTFAEDTQPGQQKQQQKRGLRTGRTEGEMADVEMADAYEPKQMRRVPKKRGGKKNN